MDTMVNTNTDIQWSAGRRAHAEVSAVRNPNASGSTRTDIGAHTRGLALGSLRWIVTDGIIFHVRGTAAALSSGTRCAVRCGLCVTHVSPLLSVPACVTSASCLTSSHKQAILTVRFAHSDSSALVAFGCDSSCSLFAPFCLVVCSSRCVLSSLSAQATVEAANPSTDRTSMMRSQPSSVMTRKGQWEKTAQSIPRALSADQRSRRLRSPTHSLTRSLACTCVCLSVCVLSALCPWPTPVATRIPPSFS